MVVVYAVIRWYNYRKNVSFKIVNTFVCLEKADSHALQCAEDEFGSEAVVQGVEQRVVNIDEVYDGYTKGDGYDCAVYSVIRIPEAMGSVGGDCGCGGEGTELKFCEACENRVCESCVAECEGCSTGAAGGAVVCDSVTVCRACRE